MPSSSRSSRITAASGVSPGLSLPPGNSHSPAIALPSGRRASSTRPAPSISAHAATSTSGLDPAAPGFGPASSVTKVGAGMGAGGAGGNRSSRVASKRSTGCSPPRARNRSRPVPTSRNPIRCSTAAEAGLSTATWASSRSRSRFAKAQRDSRPTASAATPWPQNRRPTQKPRLPTCGLRSSRRPMQPTTISRPASSPVMARW